MPSCNYSTRPRTSRLNLSTLKTAFSTRRLAIAAGFLVVYQLLSLAAPYLIKVAIDDGIAPERMDVLWMVGAAGVLIYGGSALSRFGGMWLSTKVGEEAWHRLRCRMFEHIQGMTLAEIRRKKVGGLVSRIYSDTYKLKQLATSVMPSLISLLVGVGGTAIILLVLAPRLVLLALIPLPIGFFVLRWFRKYVRPLTREKMEHYAGLHSALHEAIAGAEDVKALCAQEEMASRVDASGTSLKDAELELAWHKIRLGPTADFGISLVLLGTLVGGGYLAIEGDGALTVGTLVVFYVYVGRCLGPIRRIPGLVYAWHSARAAMERMEEILSIDDEIGEPDEPLSAEPGPLAVDFEAVEFAYTKDPESVALDGFDFSLAPGGRAAILGPSGVGKTTTARLLLRLMDGDAGTLSLQEVPVREWSVEALRRRIGYVGQEVFLFAGTLRANLTIGCAVEPTDEEIAEAIDAAGLRDVVDGRSAGLKMEVGERGDKLSGGQKKRVALARAILRSPDLLIVDQMATDLEERLNEQIFCTLRDHGMTLVYFGHRVPAGLAPEQVYWMERGRVRPYEPGQFEAAAPSGEESPRDVERWDE